MAASKKPRKKHRPKYVAKNVMSTIFGGLSGDHMAHLQSIMAKNHKAMQSIVLGAGTRDDWDLIVGAVNMSLVLAEQGIGPEYHSAIVAARDAMTTMGKRARRLGRFGFTGSELQVMNEGMDIHDAQLTNIRAIDLHRAAEEVQRRFRAGINCTSINIEIESDMRAATLARVA